MNLVVCTREQAVGVTHDKPWAVISIRNPGGTPVEFNCPNLKGVLYLEFDDTDRLSDHEIAFTLDMARTVWDFVESHKEVDTILVHCLLGHSRSPAIAAAIDKTYTGDDSKWYKTKVPNRRVFRCMLHVAEERGLFKMNNDDRYS